MPSATFDWKIVLAMAGLLVSCFADATPQAHTDRAAFDAALPGAPTNVDFDSATVNALIRQDIR